MVPGFASVLVSTLLELFDAENGVVSHIRFGYKIVWSWDMYSIDGINRGYARPNQFGRPKLELCAATDTRFSGTQMSEMRDIW